MHNPIFLDDDETYNASVENDRFGEMIILRKTKRMHKFYPPALRSKYLAISNQVVQAGNHYIHEFQQGREVNVPTSVGFLHHYRASCADNTTKKDSEKCVIGPTVVDRTMYKYKEKLLKNMNTVFQIIHEQCKLL